MNPDAQYMVVRDFESVPGGWKYTVPETGFTVTGEYFKDLYSNVRRHCEANSLPLPDQEVVEDAACRETAPGPSKCRERPPKPVAGVLPFLTLNTAERFLRTVWQALKDRKIVPEEEAERRHRICVEDCPLAGDIGGCGGCFKLVSIIAKAVPKNTLPDIPDKRFCLACGCVTAVKAHLTNATLDRAEVVRPKYWSGCWRLEENRTESP